MNEIINKVFYRNIIKQSIKIACREIYTANILEFRNRNFSNIAMESMLKLSCYITILQSLPNIHSEVGVRVFNSLKAGKYFLYLIDVAVKEEFDKRNGIKK